MNQTYLLHLLTTVEKTMKKNWYILTFTLLLLVALANSSFAADTLVLQHVTYNALSPETEVVTFQLNGSYSPKTFTLKDETPRIVFDFEGVSQGPEVANLMKFEGSILKKIRVGLHHDNGIRTRVVFDLATFKGVAYTTEFDEKKNLFTVRLTGSTPPASDENNEDKPAVSPPAKQPAPAATKPSQEAQDAGPQPEKKASPSTAQPPATNEQPAVTAEKEEIPEKAAQPAPTPEKAQESPQKDKKESAASVEKQDQQATVASKKEKQAKKPEQPQLDAIQFDKKSPKGEMVLFRLNGFYPPQIQGIEEGTPRVILNFKNALLNEKVKKQAKVNGKYVKKIRVAKQTSPNSIKVVLDLEPKKSYDLQQVFFKEDNLFVIIVNTAKK